MRKIRIFLFIAILLFAGSAYGQGFAIRLGSGSGGGAAGLVGGNLVIAVPIVDDTGSLMSGGTTTLSLFRLRSDGSLDSYDFNDNTFKTTALTTATVSMTYRKGNNNTSETGTWSYSLSTVTAFASGNQLFAVIQNSNKAGQDRLYWRY